jgi:hypothetical protein
MNERRYLRDLLGGTLLLCAIDVVLCAAGWWTR